MSTDDVVNAVRDVLILDGRELTDAEWNDECNRITAASRERYRLAKEAKRAGQVERNRAAFARDLAAR